ncbi:MAG TPA: hypothetical protein VIH79_01475 [Candidatus Nanopelagicaceae bacterium]
MLKRLRTVILVGVVIIGISGPAFGGTSVIPKPGSPCPKVQTSVMYKGLTYACLMQGKKTLWSPGKKFSANTGQQGKNPTSTGTSSPAPIPAGLKTFFDAGRFGIVRNISSKGQLAQKMDCTKSDGNQGFRSDKTFVVDPNNPLHLSLGVEYLGFYISEDGGNTWKDSSAGLIGYPRIDDPLKPCHTEFAVVAVDPNNSQHMILGRAGEPGTITDYFSENNGLYETRDGGKNWKQILTQPNLGVYVHDGLAISHQNSDVIYAGTSSIPRKLDGSNKIYTTVGIIYKTINDGKSWVELPTGAPTNTNVLNIFIDPSNDNIVTVATDGRIQTPGAPSTFNSGMGFIRTIDGGKTWNRIDTLGSPLFDVEFSVNSPKNVVACCSTDGKLMYSSDGGATWQSNDQFYSPRAFAFDPFDKSGLTGLLADNSGAIFGFASGGSAASPAGTLPSVAGLSTRVTKFAFGSDGTWYAAGHYTGTRGGAPYQEGFVFKSNDRGATWLRILDTTKLEH